MKPSRILTMTLLSATLAACGGGSKKGPTTTDKVADGKPDDASKQPPPPPPCVKAGDAAIWGAATVADTTYFCTGESSSAAGDCFAVDTLTGEYKKGTAPLAVAAPAVTVTTTATEVTVCQPAITPIPEEGAAPAANAPAAEPSCIVIKPKIAKPGEDQLVATANEKYAVIINGATAEVWDAIKNKKLKDIKFQKGAPACVTPILFGENLIINAKTCEGPSAHATLYQAKTAKKIADIGGKSFGTHSDHGLQAVLLDGQSYAFLEEFGAQLAIQDLSKGKVTKTIDLAALWQAGDAPAASEGEDAAAPAEAAAAIGNPGTSMLASAAGGKVVVVSGGPTPGNLAVVDTASGEVKIITAPVCK